jgi:hypothetical protein
MPLELEDKHDILINEKYWHNLVKLYEACKNYESKNTG